MRISPAGDRAVLVTFDPDISAAELHGRAEFVRSLPGVERCVPGFCSLLVVGDFDRDSLAIAGRVAALPPQSRRLVVSFHDDYAIDLAELPVSREEFLARIGDIRLTARFLGFRGGFAYLDGWPPEWALPRRATSRPLVARGTFAIAGTMAGFYPLDSPGGWNLLGRAASLPAIAPGDEITIEPTLERVAPLPLETPPPLTLRDVELIAAPLAIVTDRPFDEIAAARANEAAGNPPDAPLLECAMTWPRLRSTRTIAWCGPDGVAHLGEPEGRILSGLRGYVAVSRAGFQPAGPPAASRRGDRLTIRARRGPDDGVSANVIECEVTPQLNRVGIRLRPLVPLTAPADLPSCGMLCGTVQLHPDGTLVAMGPDHPITGGYLQPFTVLTAERWKLAQLVPGERMRFLIED